ncbi:MAG: FKBP-type peptidyl-prolyl cis-trans isomerase [Candidatus Micrarchaeota archaeon]|nr:FKBP-type peptidyl-prolyl cis-trans isomerase [Candidatus Micrarchaeota archaeon]
MVFKDGDFLEVEYSAWTAADDNLIATTDEKKAKEGGIYDGHTRYGPVLVVLGSNSVIKGLDRELRSAGMNEAKKMTFKPADAFGERELDLIRVMPIAEFRKRDIDPYPGLEVNIDNAVAIVKSVNSGRVTVDLNHRYAGQDVTYEIKVTKHLTSEVEMINALGKTYSVEPSKAEVKGKTISIGFNDAVKKNSDYFVGRANLIASLFTYFKEIERIEVSEEYLRPKQDDVKAEGDKQPAEK